MIVHIERMEDGSRRCTAITEVQRMESDVITLQDIFEFKVESFAPDGTINGKLAPDRPAADLPREVREARRSTSPPASSRTARSPTNVADLRR